MAFDMNEFSNKVNSTMNGVKTKHSKALKVIELTAKGIESPEIENQRKQDVMREFDD